MIEMPLAERPRDPIRGPADYEIKFAVPASAAGSLRTWIGSVCRPDAAHPPARVTTVYFDTPSLAFLAEKIDSDYLKTKVRVRWYGPSDSRASRSLAKSSTVSALVATRCGWGSMSRRPIWRVGPCGMRDGRRCLPG